MSGVEGGGERKMRVVEGGEGEEDEGSGGWIRRGR